MNLTPEEKKLLERLINEDKGWDDDLFKSLKAKIKDEFLKDEKQCCYCAKDFMGEFKLVIDIEHILPKSIFSKQRFDIENLSLACKRCNMMIKKDRIDFLSGDLKEIAKFFKDNKNIDERLNFINRLNSGLYNEEGLRYKDSDFYKFIHPNIDRYYDHLHVCISTMNGKKYCKYYPQDKKGNFTYSYFRLEELEQGDLDTLQGITIEITNNILTLGQVV